MADHDQPGHDSHLHTWCRDGKYKEVEEYIRTTTDRKELEAKLRRRRGVYGYTPLHEAVNHGHHKMLDILVEHGADVNCRANSKYTPLHLAASLGDVNCVRVLLNLNADIYAIDEFGRTPIRTAELIGKQSVVKVLKSEELIRAVRSSDANLNELLKTPQNQLESNCINRVLLTAVHSGNSNNVGKLILRRATNIDEALEESKKLQKHDMTATLLIIKAAMVNDISLVKTLYGEESSSQYDDLLGIDSEQICYAAKHSVKTVVAIEIARRTSATAVREILLLKTDIQVTKGIVSWHGLQLLQLEVNWLKEIAWVKVLKLARNELSVLPVEMGNYLKNCTVLNLAWNKLKEIPHSLLQLPCITDLNLSYNLLAELPEVPEWPFSLLLLNLSHNRLSKLSKSTIAFSIEKLDLSFNQFRSVPTCVCSFITLLTLDLSGNCKINSLPIELGRLKKLYDLRLDGLEDLNDPPKHVRLSTVDCMRYLNSRLRGEQGYYRMKLMLVGKQSMGKSTIVARLQGQKIGNESTVGVDVSEWKYSPSYKKKEYTFSIWDFAGQEEYYATHQCFLSKRSLYLLCWNIMERDKGINDLKPWMNNISLRAPGSSVVVVATFLDMVSDEDKKSGLVKELCQKVYDLGDQFARLKIFHSMAVGLQGKQENVTQLKEMIYNAASECTIGKQLVMGVKIPASYLTLDTKLVALREKVQAGKAEPIMHSGDFKEMVRSLKLVDLQDDDELSTVTHFLHEVGSLLHYDDRRHNLDDLYFVDPQWLCKLMSAVVTVEQKNPYLKHGILKTRNIPILFKNKLYPSKYMYQYLTLLHRFEIALPLDREHSRILVPSLLPVERPDCENEVLEEQCYRRYIVFRYATPPGLWGRLLSRVMSLITEVRDYLEDLEPLISEHVIATDIKTSKRSLSFPKISSQRLFSVPEVPSQRLFSFSATSKPFLKRHSVSNTENDNEEVFADTDSVAKEMDDEINLVYWRSGLLYHSPSLQFRIESLADVHSKRQQKFKDGVLVECSMDARGSNIFGQLLDIVEGLISEWYPGLERNYESCVPCTECLKSNLDTVKEFQVKKLLPYILENKTTISCNDSKDVKIHDVQLSNLVPELLFKDLDEQFLLKPKEVVFSKSKESLLGEGGFGRIYKGTYRDQSVAVKLYIEQSSEKLGAWIKDLISESKILQRLRHPCLISMVGVCINPMALVLEVAPLGSLSGNLYKPHVVIPRIVVHRMAVQVVSALRFLHSIHIIFRDLKAANVLVWSFDPDHLINCKVTDFNTSTFIDPGGTRGFSGTKGFVAPEVAHVNKAKERSIYNHTADVFSFGMLLYQMIARQRPFHNLPSYSVQPAIEDGQRPSLDDLPVTRNRFFYLTHIMKKCWQGNPDNRPSTDQIVSWLCSASLQLTLSIVPFKNDGSIKNAFATVPLSSVESKFCGKAWIFFDNTKGTTLNVLSLDTMRVTSTQSMEDNKSFLCAQQHKDYLWVATRIGLEYTDIVILDQFTEQVVHEFVIKDTCVNCIVFYDQVVCFGTMDGICMLFRTDVDVKTIRSDSFIKLSCVSDHSISGIVLTPNNLWVATHHQILLLDCETLDVVGTMRPPESIDLSVGKMVFLESVNKIWSAYMGGYIISLWDVQNKAHDTYVNIQQLVQERCYIKDPIDIAITAINVAMDTVWVGMGSGHILVFSSSAVLLTVLKPFKNYVRFLVPVPASTQNNCMMLCGGKNFEPDESLHGLPNYPCEDDKREHVDKSSVVVLWDVLPAKHLRHVQYLSPGKAWLNYSTLEEAVEDTGLSTQVKTEPLAFDGVDVHDEAIHISSDGDLRTGCSLVDFQTDFGHTAGSTFSDESPFENSFSYLDLSEEPHTDTTAHSDVSPTDDSEQQKEVISFKLPDGSTIVLSFQKPLTIKSLTIDVLNSVADAQTMSIALYYSPSDDNNNMIPLKSQEQLEEYLSLNNRPSLTVHAMK